MRLLKSLLLVFIVSCKPALVQKPIPFPEKRVKMSLEYMKDRYGMEVNYPSIVPRIVVVHWTAIPTFESSWNAFKDSEIPGFRTAIAGASQLNVSAQYLIDRDGKTYQLMPDTLFARHTIGLNHAAIGIENVGGSERPLNGRQFRANLKLIQSLIDKYPIEYVIGHHEYQKFIGHPLWKETDPNYLTSKSDPGDKFMLKLRGRLPGIKGPPK